MRVPTENLEIPETLRPERAQQMLPEPSVAELRELKSSGWERLGAITAMLDSSGQMLMLEHKGSDKTPDGALGPMAETSQLAYAGDDIVVETTAHTLARAIYEELGVKNPSSLGLRAKKMGAWALNDWPVGVGYSGQHALAICPVVHIGSSRKEELLDTFAETEEIRRIMFADPMSIVTNALTRPGTREWVYDIMSSGLAVLSQNELVSVSLPSPQALSGGVDVKMATIKL